MLNIYTVAFFGHRNLNNYLKVEKLLEAEIRKIIYENEYIEFLVGRNGEFDICVSSVVKRLQKEYRNDNSSLVLALPYITAEYANNKIYFEEYYDSVEISYNASVAHPKAAIQIRNQEMVDRADLIICYVEDTCGGAYKTMQYAHKCKKKVFNIANIQYI